MVKSTERKLAKIAAVLFLLISFQAQLERYAEFVLRQKSRKKDRVSFAIKFLKQ